MNQFLGQIQLFPNFHRPVSGWMPCDGRLLQINRFSPLYMLIEGRFGGDKVRTFALPNYTNLAPKGCQYYIAIEGMMPSFG